MRATLYRCVPVIEHALTARREYMTNDGQIIYGGLDHYARLAATTQFRGLMESTPASADGRAALFRCCRHRNHQVRIGRVLVHHPRLTLLGITRNPFKRFDIGNDDGEMEFAGHLWVIVGHGRDGSSLLSPGVAP
jgi:hypothetical protein